MSGQKSAWEQLAERDRRENEMVLDRLAVALRQKPAKQPVAQVVDPSSSPNSSSGHGPEG